MKHYAGDVTYASVGFREKNKDTLHLSGVMRSRNRTLCARSSPTRGGEPGEGRRRAAARRGRRIRPTR